MRAQYALSELRRGPSSEVRDAHWRRVQVGLCRQRAHDTRGCVNISRQLRAPWRNSSTRVGYVSVGADRGEFRGAALAAQQQPADDSVANCQCRINRGDRQRLSQSARQGQVGPMTISWSDARTVQATACRTQSARPDSVSITAWGKRNPDHARSTNVDRDTDAQGDDQSSTHRRQS